MKNISNEFLLNAYEQAVLLNLSPHFISLLKLEIHRRNLEDQLNETRVII